MVQSSKKDQMDFLDGGQLEFSSKNHTNDLIINKKPSMI